MPKFEVTFPVRYYETDQMAVVHHSNYIRYFEVARNQMMVEVGFPIERLEKELGVMIPIVSVECHFKHPARMGDTLTASASFDKIPLAKMVIHQEVKNQDGVVCADGEVVLGFIDSKTFRPIRCPREICELFQKYMA